MELLPVIPEEHESRFRDVLNSTAHEALCVFPPLLAVCFVSEAYSHFYRTRTLSLLVLLPLACGLAMLLFAVGMWRKKKLIAENPFRHSPRYVLLLLSLPYFTIVMNFPDGSLDRMETYLALLLFSISVFVLPGAEWFFGAGLTAVTMVLMLVFDPRSRFDDLIGLSVAAVSISVMAWLCRQRSLRQSFLRLLAAEDAVRKLQNMQSEIERVQKLEGLETLAGGIAHDFNNLLVPVLANASGVQHYLPDDHKLAQPIEGIILAAERAAKLTEQLLVYTGRNPVVKQDLCMESEVNSIVHLLQSSLPKGVYLSMQVQGDLPPVRASSTQIQQVLLNLVINGGQAIGPHGGNVRIQLGEQTLTASEAGLLEPRSDRPDGAYVVCEITDNGCGMTAEIRDRMFDPFFTSKQDGHGLGLSAVLGIVRNHNGGLRVESTPGQGTTISLFLPASAVEMKTAPAQSTSLQIHQCSETILLIDDEQLVRRAALLALEKAGYRVVTAVDGNDGLRQFTAAPRQFHAAIIDVQMPGPGVLEIVLAMRRIQPSLKILTCSGLELDESLQQLSLPFLAKPYSSRTLCDAVAALFQDQQPARNKTIA